MKKTTLPMIGIICAIFLAWMINPFAHRAQNQQGQPGRPAPTPTPTPTLGLENGYVELDTPDFRLKLVKASQTIAALQPKGANGFDFTPADRLERRASDGYQHLGDLTLRVRENNKEWKDYATAAARKAVAALPASGSTLAAADLAPTLPADCPVQITRSWMVEKGRLVLRFDLKNKTAEPLQIGALGIPMGFNNHITGRNLQQSHEICSFADPYIGQDAGYLQVTRLSGAGPALVVVPEGKTPFEAWQLLNEPMRPAQTFEGTFAWMAHSLAYAEKEWKGVEQWNPPTSATLAPGATRSYGVRFLVSDQIRNIEKTLAADRRPVAVGIPGYVLPRDHDAKLLLKAPANVEGISSEPAGAITIRKEKPAKGWQSFALQGKEWGRARLRVKYADGAEQTIHYYVIKPASVAVADLGNFLMTKQWYEDPNDPFHRSPSVMSYDRETDRILLQDSRVWIAGLGDEGGSGSWLAAAMKQFGQPNRAELAKYEQFIDKVLWGGLQYSEGPNKYGVRKSLFFYSPQDVPGYAYDPALNWTTWTSWKKADAESIGRGFNYPHVVAAYWSLYRVARNHVGLVTNHPWDWYLEQAYQTTKFTFSRLPNNRRRVGYVELGLMEGDIFLAVLQDLKREGWTEKANEIEAQMRERTERWKNEAYPFGSEMAWDSTGQEEVYAWCDYFGYDDKALVSLNSILGYMPTVPHWGYNGSARRYWDFVYAGKLRRIERQLHHYGSSINAIPALAHFRKHPEDEYLLRIGYAGTMGALTNIDQEGFASVAFHSFPSTLKWDGYSGDYGPNFFGHAFNTAAYLINHSEFGWQAFGGGLKQEGDWLRLTPDDSFRMRVYLASRGLWLTLDAGRFAQIALNLKTGLVRVGLDPATPETPQARLRIEQPAKLTGVGRYQPRQSMRLERDAVTVPLQKGVTWVELGESR